MAKKVAGITAVVLTLLGLFVAIAGLMMRKSYGTDAKCEKVDKKVNDLGGRVIRNEVYIEVVQKDISDIKKMQTTMHEKLDKALENRGN